MVRFLERASVAAASSRDAALVPRLHVLSGWSVDEGDESVTCLLPAHAADGLVERLARHAEIAMVAEVIGPHECYQFKGRFLDHRPAEASDLPVFEACRRRFIEAVQRHMPGRFPEGEVSARYRDPVLAVRFAVDEIYVQTPGPAAGKRLVPREGP